VGLAVLAVLTTACSVHLHGTPLADTPSTKSFPNPDRIEAEDALGDLTTWNPCSVVDLDELPKAWTTTVDSPAAFEECSIAVTTDDGVVAEIQVGYLYESDHDLNDDGAESRAGGLIVVPNYDSANACARDIVFADSIALEVRTWSENQDKTDALCAISDEVVDHVVDAVMAGRAESLRFPDNSLGEIDACELVTAEVVAVVPGLSPAVRPEPQVSTHSCWWANETADAMLNIEFEIGHLPVGDSGSTVDGRFTAVTQYADGEDSSLCLADGEHVPFKYDSKQGLMERVAIYVYQKPGQVEAACTAASAVAAALWPKLPPL
jgi:hypothetical protein